ncbi:MAG: glycosyltransferase [Oscillospiraceae bacterium]|nr:glycosyltransferase [Oscillospiraceae bacterium]
MNIALFTDSYIPMHNGVAHSVNLLKKGLVSLGHRVCVVRPSIPGCCEVSNLAYLSASFPFAPEMRISVTKSRYVNDFMHEFSPDVIHTHTEFMLGRAGMHFAKKLHCAHIHTYHTLYEDYTHYVRIPMPLTLSKSLARTFSANFCNKAQAVIVPSEKVRLLLGSYGTYSPIFSIPTGIDVSMFQKDENTSISSKLRKKFAISENDKILLFVGRICEEKNIDELIYWFSLLCKKRSDCILMLVGFCENKSEYLNLANKLECAQRIRFCGMHNYENIAHFYKLCDVFVSASESETQGLTYIEALSSSRPVLAKNDACLKGVVKNGYNGFLFENAGEFINGFERLVGNEKLRFRQNAHESSSDFGYLNYAKSVLNIYKKAANVKV